MLTAVMNAMFDTHVHFDMIEDPAGVPAIVARAREAGVRAMIAVGGDDKGNRVAAETAAAHAGVVWAAIGLNRDCATADSSLEQMIAALERSIEEHHPVAIGEIGLDFHYHPETRSAQIALFDAQLQLARRLKLPVIVHCREAEGEVARMLEKHASEWRGEAGMVGILHCFTGGEKFARDVLVCGMYISFSGIVTFANADPLRRVAAMVPADRLLIETDSPFLAPVPLRGRKNEPAFVANVASVLAKIRKSSPDEIAAITWSNACALFNAQKSC